MNPTTTARQWDIFCKVIDNFGDIGVCWRLCRDLAARGQNVRLWVDDASALAWMAPGGCVGVEVLHWADQVSADALKTLKTKPADIIVEAFGCEITPEFIATYVHEYCTTGIKPLWINLEYLSAESYVERCHALPSPVSSGPAAGWTKWFFYPGFTPRTGGLLRETDLPTRQARFDRQAWLASQGIRWQPDAPQKLVSLFCYEPAALKNLLAQWASQGMNGQPVQLLVAAGRAEKAVREILTTADRPKPEKMSQIDSLCNTCGHSLLSISYLPWLTQESFDQLLWACDLNFVRGEDSVIRAIWAGKPFVWQIYPQDDDAHEDKLNAFLDMMQAPASLRDFHQLWNSKNPSQGSLERAISNLGHDLPDWSQAADRLRSRLLAQHDLTSSLLQFITKTR